MCVEQKKGDNKTSENNDNHYLHYVYYTRSPVLRQPFFYGTTKKSDIFGSLSKNIQLNLATSSAACAGLPSLPQIDMGKFVEIRLNPFTSAAECAIMVL